MIQESPSLGKIVAGYEAWIQGERDASKKIEFGTWWRLNETYWRVLWIEATGELYAAERKPSDRYVVLGCLDKKHVTDLMRKWFDGDNLNALFGRFKQDSV
jgi:hypothetical protein